MTDQRMQNRQRFSLIGQHPLQEPQGFLSVALPQRVSQSEDWVFVYISSTCRDCVGSDVSIGKNESSQLIDLRRESQEVGTDQLRQKRGRVFTQAHLPF